MGKRTGLGDSTTMTQFLGKMLLLSLCCAHAQSSNSGNSNLTKYLKWLLPADGNVTQLSDPTKNLGLLHCNNYCNGSTKSRYVLRICTTSTPKCRPCQCDENCQRYGDCCPDENGEFSMKMQKKYDCSNPRKNIHFMYGRYHMIKSCPDQVMSNKQTTFSGLKMSSACMTSPGHVAPVTSLTSNLTYINECIAVCNNDTDYIKWTLERNCKKNERIKDFVDANESSHCTTFIYPPSDIPVRRCNPVFSQLEYIDTCNSTGRWDGSTFDIDVDVQCKEWYYYPVTANGYVFKNIYCFLCNGFMAPNCENDPFSRGISINSLVSLSRSSNELDKMQCRDQEWYDHVKKVCRTMHCRQGYILKEETCLMSPVVLPNVQYHFMAVFWSTENHTLYPQLPNIEPMVVQTLPELLSPYNLSECVFTVFNHKTQNERIIDFRDTDDKSTSSQLPKQRIPTPAFRLDLLFRSEQKCCRTNFEQHLSILFEQPWIFNYNDSVYAFNFSSGNVRRYATTERQSYRMSSPDMNPVETDLTFLEYGQIKETITLPITYKQCVFVNLLSEEFIWNDHKSITLTYTNATIKSAGFTLKGDDTLVICLDTLKKLYRTFNTTLRGDSIQNVKNIVSRSFSVVSLVCLALTSITFCTFPSLLTLPTKNTMCLVVFLFLAQLLLQFGELAARDETTCKVIGVLLHYFWLSVIFWMNVCSYHMFHVFVLDVARPISTRNQRIRLLKYFLYANGSPLIIVIITVAATLGTTSGNQMGYGNGPCYLSTALLTGVSFVLPLGIILILNIIFFSISVWTMVKIHKMSKTIGCDKSQVHIYMKLSTLTGIFWVLAILAEIFKQQFLFYISIILNASQGIFIFFSYVVNRHVYQLWIGKLSQKAGVDRQQSTETTETSRMSIKQQRFGQHGPFCISATLGSMYCPDPVSVVVLV